MESKVDKSLLDIQDESEDYMSNFLFEKNSLSSQIFREPQYALLTPEPGFCLKTKTSEGRKIFINICQSSNIPQPSDITEEELKRQLEADEESTFRVPMSIGDPHIERDKSDNEVTVYDVVINHKFYEKIEQNELFYQFLVLIAFEGVESKYGLKLSRELIRLKNKKFFGDIKMQTARTKASPLIREVKSSDNEEKKTAPTTEWKEPKFQIVREPVEGYPQFLVAEIQLPHVNSAHSVLLDVGEDRILLHESKQKYRLDIYIPYRVIQEEVVAQFSTNTKILTVTMPVQQEVR